MSKETIKKEIETLKKEASIYGWNDHKSKEYEKLKNEWYKCVHYNENGQTISPPNI
ncbi:hypothetical protein [Myroides odoratus]|uniref:Uncharacterized protein n=1 Tax=Myroides odoratus TaxID=256 RepID=A0A378RRR3_MYROD|nr:hypothetical protein [Myroides odoratus]QQU04204.1 hypothetical protein I6I89_02645 [Myroides odoratus]STZ28390.1 Uncharacterised protein [Myroides odoratus]